MQKLWLINSTYSTTCVSLRPIAKSRWFSVFQNIDPIVKSALFYSIQLSEFYVNCICILCFSDSFTDIATTTVNTAYSLIGIIIGVIVGVIVLIIIIVVAICVCCCRQATGRRTQGHVVMQPANPQYPPQPGVYPAQPGVYPPQT